MAESQENDNPVVDSQDTYYEKDANTGESQMLDESQDFALVVAEDSDESITSRSQAVKNVCEPEAGGDSVEQKTILAETQLIKDSPTKPDIVHETQNIHIHERKLSEEKDIQSLNMEDNAHDSKCNEKKGSDEEEIIQGTPPQISSPSRKRKADSFDEPATKIQRTLSQRDALKLDRNMANADTKLIVNEVPIEDEQKQLDILSENTEDIDDAEKLKPCVTQSQQKNVIIAETQDSDEFEPVISSDLSALGNTSSNVKSDESDQKNTSSPDKRDSELDTANSKPNSFDSNSALSDNEKVVPQPDGKMLIEASDETSERTTNGEDVQETTEDDKMCNTTDDSPNIVSADLIEKQSCKSTKFSEKKGNVSHEVDKEFFNVPLPTSDSNSESTCDTGSHGSNKSRMSIEVIYDRKSSSQEKKRCLGLVEIDEEGEKIILDDSNEESPKNTTIYKSCLDSKTNSDSSYKSTGGAEVHKHNDDSQILDCHTSNEDDLTMSSNAKTVSLVSESDPFADDVVLGQNKGETSESVADDLNTEQRFRSSPKLNDTLEMVNVVTDSEGDSLVGNVNAQKSSDNKIDNSLNTSLGIKTTIIEKKTRFYVDLKYILHIDETTKEIMYKEVTDVHCEPVIEHSAARRNSDVSGCLADISGNANKDNSPGSVMSNPQLFSLPPSRLSIASTVSSSSSLSSAASLAAKLLKNTNFSEPKGRAKHARKPTMEVLSEEKITDGWKNTRLISEALLQSANAFIHSPESFQLDNEPGKIEDKVLSSTPEVIQDTEMPPQVSTPKSTKDKKLLKRKRATNGTAKSNGIRKVSPEIVTTSQEARLHVNKKRESIDSIQSDKLSKQVSSLSTPVSLSTRTEKLRSLTPQNLPNDELIGKVVFAKWSDNTYYPGEVTGKTKDKYRIKFYDGKSKLVMEEFVIPMPESLREGLSVYATSKEDSYASMGIILKSENVKNVIYYTVEMDTGEKIRVQINDISLMPGQAQILKEEIDVASQNLPKTPQHLGQVSLDNLVDGKRRSRRAATPTVSTPKLRKVISPRSNKTTKSISPSGSGLPKLKGNKQAMSSSESETKTNESDISATDDVDGVEPELLAMPSVPISKGPSDRMKGRGRGKSKQIQDDAELGPIPPPSSSIFENMSFILTSTSSDVISRHHTDDSCSEPGTENEEEWLKTPFVKDRVKKQLINGGGIVYDSFKQIPQSEYKKVKLITNVPNLTAKSIQCLSVGIPTYSHNWVIQCCRDNKTLKPTPYELPAGWSEEKRKYIESYDRLIKQPFSGMIIALPVLDNRNVINRTIQFWRSICENAGAVVQIVNDPETDLSHVTAVLTDNRCPSWLVEKADSLQIPLVSTVWIVQCIIVGQSLQYDSHPKYSYNFMQP
ncbi:TP53-binding protein 1-like [Diprion similis]|uniref:TP53-binding protein 1-like n=1 Tax=Diprion similis TaxID=362088 RepID=UPI001EF84C77|nr:TP53-binding protein 1-like [Diprion similis]XP_046749547.1 TP53-binding protein 1-like [Diprion similis]